MLNPTNFMVKYIHCQNQSKNPSIIFLTIFRSIDRYQITDIYLVLYSTNNFFKKLLKKTEEFFLTIVFHFTVLILKDKYSSTHAKEILA